jgi:lipopolysaccharide export LptBFGC system permease protein LptF
MGFGNWIGGIGLCVLAVVLALFGVVVLLGFFKFIATSYVLPLGIGMLVIALFMFAFGWYSFKSAKPQGTLNVHNQ